MNMPGDQGEQSELTTYVFPEFQTEVMILGDKSAERWILDFLGAFSRLQSAISSTVWNVFAVRNGALAKVLYKTQLTRLSDGDRWNYVKALAKDASYPGNMQIASDRFWRAKHTRDLVGHSPTFEYAFDTTTGTYGYPANWGTGRSRQVPDPLTPQSFRQLITDCNWLVCLVNHLGSERGANPQEWMGRAHDDGTVHLGNVRVVNPGEPPSTHVWQEPEMVPLPCAYEHCSFKDTTDEH